MSAFTFNTSRKVFSVLIGFCHTCPSSSLLGLRGLRKVIPFQPKWIADSLINVVTIEFSHFKSSGLSILRV